MQMFCFEIYFIYQTKGETERRRVSWMSLLMYRDLKFDY